MESMEDRKKLAAPCGLYCGVCGVLMAHRDNNIKFKERLSGVYGVTADEIKCQGCLLTNSSYSVGPVLSGPVQLIKASKGVISAVISPAISLRIFLFPSVRR